MSKMTKTQLLLMQTKQKGMRANIEGLIAIRQHLEPLSIKDRRRKRFLAKQKYFKERNVECY